MQFELDGSDVRTVGDTTKAGLSPKELAAYWGQCEKKILRWIRGGELPAVNMSLDKCSLKPRYMVPWRAITSFELDRMTSPLARKPSRRRRSAGRPDDIL